MNTQEIVAIAKNVAKKAEWVGVRRRSAESSYSVSRNAQFDSAFSSFDDGVMIEVLYKGSFGYAGTCDISVSGIKKATQSALMCAVSAVGKGVFEFSQSVRPKAVVQFESKIQNNQAVSTNEIFDILINCCHEMKVTDDIVQTTSMLQKVDYLYDIVSTNGTNIQQTLHSMGLYFKAIAQKDNIVQIRSNGLGDETRQGGWELFDSTQLYTYAKRLGSEAVELLTAESCPNDTRRLVLMPDQLMLQIHESIGHPLEIDRILGDERNYAGGSFITISDFGNFQYGSPLLNVTFDPTVTGELASYAVDETGNIATKEFLIKDGILQRGLGSLESQARSGLKGVANERASSWNRAPIDRMANINIEPGTSSFDDIISNTEKGIIMESNRSWSIDDYRNKFQFGCEYGKLIENGKITKTVRDPNYRGVSSDFWRGLSMVGDASTFKFFGTANCGKGEPNQTIFVGHGSPVCAFDNVSVFGGGK